MNGLLAERGRGPVPISVFGAPADPAVLAEYRRIGVTRAVFRLPPAGADQVLPALDRYAEIVRSLMDLNVDYAQGFGLCRPVDRERLLHADHGVALIQDQKVIEVLSRFSAPAYRRSGTTGRRSILSV